MTLKRCETLEYGNEIYVTYNCALGLPITPILICNPARFLSGDLEKYVTAIICLWSVYGRVRRRQLQRIVVVSAL